MEQREGFPLSALTKSEPANKLPTEPTDWQGKIDYRSLDRDFAAIARRPEMAGLAVAIVENGDLRFVQTYGVTDKGSNDWVMPETVFRWASVSKGVAGTLAAKLSKQDRFNLESPISNWQTSLRLPGGANAQVSLAQLLSHQTGLLKNAYDRKLEAGQSPNLLRSQLAGVPLKCAPGTCHSYQNIAFDAVSELVEQAAGKSYSDVVEEQLFTPLGMESAKLGMSGLMGAVSWARPHRGDEVRTPVESYWLLPAAAGVNSNIVDMSRWMQAQMGEREDVLSVDTLFQAHSPLVDTPRVYGGALARALSDPSYGLGWRSFTYAGRRLVGHSGAVDGFRATMVFDPNANVGVVAMWNSGWGLPFRIPFAALDSYYGNPLGNRFDGDEPAKSWLDMSNIPLPEPVATVADDAR